ncbi:DNA-directed DNA polymerase [Entamoeba marina]
MKCQNDKTSARSVQSNCSGKSFAELSKPTKALVHRKFFYAIILADILNEVSLTAISERYEVPRGNIQALQQQTTAFASIVAQFCTQLGFDHLSAIFQNIVERLKYGAKEELFELVRIPGVKTRRARALYEKGIKTLEDVAKANEDVISRILLTTIPKKR